MEGNMSFLYREAGRVLKAVENGRASLKTLTFKANSNVGGGKGGDRDGPKRKLYAMVSETLRYKPLLDKLILMADPEDTLFSAEQVREKEQGYIMLYEMLFGKGSIQGGGALKRHLMQYKGRLEECLAKTKKEKGLSVDAANETLLPQHARRQKFPRYARVNLMTCPEGAEGVAASLRKEGFKVEVDDVVPSLLVLPAGTELHTHDMVKDGRLVLQDKSSCFSAEALLGEQVAMSASGNGRGGDVGEANRAGLISGDVIDACAAPGNKTMHLASLLSQTQGSVRGGGSCCSGGSDGRKAGDTNKVHSSKVYAFDKDPRRLALMRKRVNEAGGAGAIDTRLQDFFEVDPADPRYSKVTAILLDPSCSGSGIVSAPERLHDGSHDENDDDGGQGAARVKKLAEFQLSGLLKAMSFPQVRRVCYSTCSIHVEENEGVVMNALQQQPPPSPPANSNDHVTHSGQAAGAADGLLPAADLAGVGTTGIAGSSGSAQNYAHSGGRFVLSRCLPKWHRRGLVAAGADEPRAACMVRTDPTQDQTNGFFVAVFEREGGGLQESTGGGSASVEMNDMTVEQSKRNTAVGCEDCTADLGGANGAGGAGGDGGDAKKRRNRHQNRKKKKKRRAGAAAQGQAEKSVDIAVAGLGAPVERIEAGGDGETGAGADARGTTGEWVQLEKTTSQQPRSQEKKER